MEAAQLHPCPLCDSSVICWQRDGQEWHTINACAHCGIFVVASPSLPHPWARLAPEDALLVAFLPAYIQHCNRHDRTPLLTR